MNPLKLAVLTAFITPYGLPMLKRLAAKAGGMKVFVSTRMEPNRNWVVNWGDLDVVLQKNIIIPRTWRHPSGFSETLYTHFPYSTLFDLFVYRPQVVFSSEMGFRTVLAIFYKWLSHSKLILWATLSEHSEKNRGKLRNLLRRRILKNIDAVVVNGKSGARYISSFGIINPESVFFAPYTTNMAPFLSVPVPRTFSEEGIKILYVGQLTQRKGILYFLEILIERLKSYPTIPITFDLFGSGPDQDTIKKLECPKNLKLNLHDPVQYKELSKVFANSHAFIFPTLADEWGLVVNEAFASAMPIVGSIYSQAVEELVDHGENGFLFNPDMDQEIHHAIDLLLTTPVEKLEEMGKNARSRIASYTPDNSAEQIMSAVRYVLKKG